MGAEVTHDADGTWRVAGRGIGGLTEPADVLDMGNSGTAARLLCGVLASHELFAVMTGDATYDIVRDAIADLGLPLNRLEQRRSRVEELFHDKEEAPRVH